MSIFEHLSRPDEGVFYQRNDPNDVRFGEMVHTSAAMYAAADVVILGCPQDDGVRRNKGRVGAAQAPDAIRRSLYKLVPPNIAALKVFDAGNTIVQSSLEETHALHRQVVQQIISDGKRIVSLGGGNDVSYADCSGLASVIQPTMAINIDAHFDVRADEIPNSGTPYRQLLEESFVQGENFYEVANVPMVNSPTYREYLFRKKAHIIDLCALREKGVASIFGKILTNEAPAIFWGFDMDSVCAADAPGVSAPNALGLTAYEACEIARLAGEDTRSRLFEITEVNPTYDIDSRTARLAAAMIHHFLAALTLAS
jgi:formiminoglutamase